ncbi:MAG: DNA polymerase I [Candidatus Moranbacteria bacterium]|nr:DNA polymerase I [Candidatus Moranbacteria bacterium]
MPKEKKKLILIDGNAIIHRAYHAMPPLVTKKGELVNAVYGFSSTLLSVIDKFKPEYVLATFDLAGPTFRHEEYEEYKATRVKADQELYDQIPRVKEVVRAFGIPIFEAQGFEADDVIGTLVAQSEKKHEEIENIIVTGDMDTLQLVSPKTKVYTMRRGLTDSVLYGEKEVFARYGLKPEQLVDFKGLRGDPSDNIPGVKGIGEKTAITLLEQYKTVEGVYEHIAEIKGTVKDKLERDKMMAFKSKSLATISRKAPVVLAIEKALTHDFDREGLVSMFKELNFFSLVKRIPGAEKDDASKPAAVPAGVKDFKFEIIENGKVGDFVNTLKECGEISLSLRTHGEKAWNGKILGVAIGYKTGRVGYVSYSEENFALLGKVFSDPDVKKIGYDLKSDLEILRANGIELAGAYFDIMLSAYLLNSGSKIELSTLVLEGLGEEMEEEKKQGQLGLQIESEEEIASRSCQRADYIFKLKDIHEKNIADISKEQEAAGSNGNTLWKVFEDVEMPLVEILSAMEINGVKFDPDVFHGISEKIEKRIKTLEDGIYEAAGETFNINSPKQLSEILFVKLKIPTDNLKKGKTGTISTASSELKKIKDQHDVIGKIEEYREIFKLKTTYLDTLPSLVDNNSRIHTCFNQAVAATGRLSSSDPNLQNIPIRTDLGQLLRAAFVADEGWKLVSADYSQIDLRVVAHVSEDKTMIELFWKGEDIHRATAAEINKVTPSKVSDKMRSRAKELNFGVIYGMGAFGFSARTGISREEAKKFIDAYFERFQGVARYMKYMKEFAKKNGYVETEIGRRRYIPEINSSNFQVANSAERMAINMPIQGLSADIVKIAMIKVYDEYKNNPDVRMILQVHDEIILEVKEDAAEEVGKKVKEIMESAYKLKVPLLVDVHMGDNWGEI